MNVTLLRHTHILGGNLQPLPVYAAAFELSRRRDNLSFSHHAEVAGLIRDAGKINDTCNV